jgi:murein DD-endopeptidase MepM/ murein hydrolase activator NlpD
MFPLRSRQITGYRFGVPTFYNNFHLGVDYGTAGMPVYAPFNGVVTDTWGPEGGNTILFKPDNQDIVIRFMHLSRFIKKGYVHEGDVIAISGNTGNITRGKGHCHIDISKHSLQINNTRNFIDPEKFWGKGYMNPNIRTLQRGSERGIYIPAQSWDDFVALCKYFGKDPNQVDINA